MADGGERLAHRRHGRRVERRLLGRDRVFVPGGPAGEALRDEARHTGAPGGGEQVVGALRAEAVGHREALVEVPHVDAPGERGRLVDDRVGPRVDDRRVDRDRVEQVEHDRRGAERAQTRLLLGRA
jgi:hypothetical protein